MKKPPMPQHRGFQPSEEESRSSVLHDHGLAATLAVLDLQGNLLALLHVLLAGALEDGGMQEHVLATIIRRHEAEATDLVEPLDRAVNGVGRATLVAATEVAARRTVTKSARRAEATTVATKATAEAATVATEVTTGRTVAEATAEAATVATTEVTTGRTVAEATTEATARRAAEVTAGGAVAEITARRTVAEAIATEFAARTLGATRAQLALMDLGDQPAPLTVRADLADQLIAGLGGFDARFGQRRSVEEHILAIRPKYKAEPFAAVVPLHLGLNRPGATLRIAVRKHFVSYP
jgi:hypothetical protein